MHLFFPGFISFLRWYLLRGDARVQAPAYLVSGLGTPVTFLGAKSQALQSDLELYCVCDSAVCCFILTGSQCCVSVSGWFLLHILISWNFSYGHPLRCGFKACSFKEHLSLLLPGSRRDSSNPKPLQTKISTLGFGTTGKNFDHKCTWVVYFVD
jgi:hypothetical protein